MGDFRKHPYLYSGCLFGILRARGFFELEIQRHGETYDWNSEGMREGRFLEGTDKIVNAISSPDDSCLTEKIIDKNFWKDVHVK